MRYGQYKDYLYTHYRHTLDYENQLLIQMPVASITLQVFK